MIDRFGFICLLGLALMSSIGPVSAFGPVNVIGGSMNTRSDVVEVSFFGRPYPYGYTGWGPCVRYVEVQTRWGLRLRRVNICR
jgi:hypothetical protein